MATDGGSNSSGSLAILLATFAPQPGDNHRAAASALSSGRVLNAITAAGATLWTALTTVSNTARL